MTTEKTYYEDPYRKELDAVVVSFSHDKLVLDRTICYPEGGGQPGDRALVDGKVRILDTQKGEEGEIIHQLEPGASFQPGQKVHLSLDWEHRYFYMQVHTAQHMASGILFTRFQIGTVAIHEGEEILTVETDQASIDEGTCLELEDAVNTAILEGHPVHYEEVTRAEALGRHLRRSIKVGGDDIRLVVIEGVDTIACGGLHVANTREVRLVTYAGQEEIRGHVRLIFKVAGKAVEEFRRNRALVDRLCALHSAQPDTLLSVEEKDITSGRELKAQVGRMREALAGKGLLGLPSGIVTWDISNEVFDLKDVVKEIDGKSERALCAVKKQNGRLLWLIATTGSWRDFPFNQKRADLLGAVHGKGGGRDGVYQGSCEGEGEALFSVFRSVMEAWART